MKPALALALLVVLPACPERATPERGVMLVLDKPATGAADVRSTIDRRLAHLKLKAKLGEDGDSFSIRVPGDADVELIKRLVTTPGVLRFCREDRDVAARWCALGRRDGLTALGDDTCGVEGPSRAAVLEVLQPWADGGIAWEPHGDRGVAAWARSDDCRTLRVTAVEAMTEQPALMLTFDRASADAFMALTRQVIGQHLLIEFDGEVQSAPVVQSVIGGGRAMLMLGPSHQQELQLIGAVLAGGPLPPLTVTKVQAYGPPSLKR